MTASTAVATPLLVPITTTAPVRPIDARASSYIPTLDGWRALAILLVLFDHGGDSIDAFLHTFGGHLPSAMLHRGQVGVYIFFGLSGYLITSRLLAEQEREGKISLSSFYVRRLFRVFPPMALYLLIAGILTFFALIPVTAGQFVSAATFLTNYNADRGWYVGHFWSLCVEEHFYLLWPAALVLLGTRRALVGALAVTVAVSPWRYLVVNTGITGYTDNLYSRTDLVIDTLLLGSAAAILMSDPRFQKFLRQAPAWSFYAVAAAVAVTMLIRGDLMRLPQSSLLVLLMLLTVTHASAVPGRLLENPALRWLGRLSYSLYLWQQLFLVFAGWEASALGPLQKFPWNILATFACAIPSYYLVEKPLVRIGHKLTHTRSPRKAIPVATPVAA